MGRIRTGHIGSKLTGHIGYTLWEWSHYGKGQNGMALT